MYVLDGSAYQTHNNSFHTPEEAEDVAAMSALTLGRAINVYQLIAGELIFAFRVMPDGSVEDDNPLADPMPGDQIDPPSPIIKGSAPSSFDHLQFGGNPSTFPSLSRGNSARLDHLDDAAEALEKEGEIALSISIDQARHEAESGNDDGLSEVGRLVKKYAPKFSNLIDPAVNAPEK